MSKISGVLTEDNYKDLNEITNDKKNNELRKNQQLDKDAFLKLMLTQLVHQDPLSPMDNKEMIGQMAHFTSVEQLGTMGTFLKANMEQNDLMLKAITNLNGTNINSEEKIDKLLDETKKNNLLSSQILESLNELINLTKANNAYEE